MLGILRKKQKLIIWVTASAFIVGMALMGIESVFRTKEAIGKIAGKKIYPQEYQDMLNRSVENYRQQYPDREMDDQTMQMLNDQTWQQLVQKEILDKQIKKLHVKVTTDDVINKLKTDPPEMVKTAPVFQTNGKFDMSKYMNAFVTGQPDITFLEDYVRQTLPYEKLEKKIKSQAKITLDSVRIEYMENNNKVDGKVVYFDYHKVANVSVSDAEIKAYYDTNKEKEFKKEPGAKYKFVRFTLQPGVIDVSNAKQDIDLLYKQAIGGEDFATLAKENSQDPGSAQNGGDIGFISKGKMIPEIENVAFALNVNEISKPFKTNYGWHIVKVTEKKPLEVRASHILIQVVASEKTKDDLKVKVDDFYELVKKNDLAKAAAQFKYNVEETPEFDEKAQFIPSLGRYPHLVKIAFAKKIGHTVEPLKIYDGSYVVPSVSFKAGKHYEELADAKEKIKGILETKKKVELITKQAEEFAAKFQPAQYLTEATKAGLQIIDVTAMTSKGDVPGVGQVPEVATTMMKMETGQTSGLIKSDKGAFIGYVSNRIKPDMAAFEAQKSSLTESYKTKKENDHYSKWYQALVEKAEVEDYRYKFYGN